MRWGLVLVAIVSSGCGASDTTTATPSPSVARARPRSTRLPSSTPETAGEHMSITQPVAAPPLAPLPLAARVTPGLGAFDVVVMFQADGDRRWQMTKLGKEEDGVFTGYIDCGNFRSLGPVRYYATALAANGEPVGSVGSEAAPLVTEVREDAASVPVEGQEPLRACTPEEAEAHWKGSFRIITPD